MYVHYMVEYCHQQYFTQNVTQPFFKFNIYVLYPLLLFLTSLTNLFLSLPDPLFMQEQHWLKPEHFVNSFCIYAGSNAS